MTTAHSRAGFDLDLRFGQAKERTLQAMLGSCTIEVKSDQIARRTGNVFVEYKQHGRPSGIATTTANFWAIEYDEACWLITPTDRLKILARRAIRQKRTKAGGDFNNYTGTPRRRRGRPAKRGVRDRRGHLKRPAYRAKALAAYGNRCSRCGRCTNIEVHHRDGNPQNSRLSNLQVLCHRCHVAKHSRTR